MPKDEVTCAEKNAEVVLMKDVEGRFLESRSSAWALNASCDGRSRGGE
jgi:hypothetical protein